MNFIDRKTDRATFTGRKSLFPVTVILGLRQRGKTTLARSLAPDSNFDLENPPDLARLEHSQLALEDLTNQELADKGTPTQATVYVRRILEEDLPGLDRQRGRSEIQDSLSDTQDLFRKAFDKVHHTTSVNK